MKRLSTQLQIRHAKAGVYAISGASGFGFKKVSDEEGGGAYTVRFRLGDKRPIMGLGAYGEISLAGAREAAKEAVKLARSGVNPIAERDRQRAANLAAEKKAVTCREAAKVFFDKTKGAWRGRYYAQSWWSQMVRFVFPVVGDIPIGDLLSEHIAAIRMATNDAGAPSTGRQIQSRLGEVADMAVARGWRGAAQRNPADARQVDAFLPAKRSQGEPSHFRRIDLTAAPAAFLALIEAGKQGSGGGAVGSRRMGVHGLMRPAPGRGSEYAMERGRSRGAGRDDRGRADQGQPCARCPAVGARVRDPAAPGGYPRDQRLRLSRPGRRPGLPYHLYSLRGHGGRRLRDSA
jgi:Arm DNA-binding domain